MSYTTSKINKEWLIKVYGNNGDGVRLNKLVGVLGLIELVGVELANKMVCRAFNERDMKTVCKLRRGLKVTFYAH